MASRTLGGLPAAVQTPGYDRRTAEPGVVHLGAGAFFRAHQADRYDRLLAMGDTRWAACGVSLRSAAVRDALALQDGLYTLAELNGDAPLRVIGALREVLTAPADP
ncbi:MAG: mannitol dehydrogenase family protein, partial [Caulobacteraceae bacterium]|nr:mannitol dehydrogenase family protein [Caulobacter sp.]